jgi:hypothetical protein
MEPPSWIAVAGLLIGMPAAAVALLTACGMVWRGYRQWRQALIEEAYERAAKEAVLSESQRTVSQLEKELAVKDAALQEVQAREWHCRTEEIPRLQRRTDKLTGIVQSLACALDSLQPRGEADR